MKKKYFNDNFGQTESVLNGTKTMFREVYKCPAIWDGIWVSGYIVGKDGYGNIVCTYLVDEDEREIPGSYIKSKYAIGGVVAVAQSYEDAESEWIKIMMNSPKLFDKSKLEVIQNQTNVSNKVIVKADLMPHQIEITGIKLERLQDISNEDCIKEGIYKHISHARAYYMYNGIGNYFFYTRRDAYASLVEDIFGKGTWEQNPYVIAYEFKLIN